MSYAGAFTYLLLFLFAAALGAALIITRGGTQKPTPEKCHDCNDEGLSDCVTCGRVGTGI